MGEYQLPKAAECQIKRVAECLTAARAALHTTAAQLVIAEDALAELCVLVLPAPEPESVEPCGCKNGVTADGNYCVCKLGQDRQEAERLASEIERRERERQARITGDAPEARE